ncbi:MAG: radical SAM protein [Thermodesulfobacteriota bacterium]|nr:radical SAM protein [Thermodesulfobacteriota bacterium]
MFEQGPIRPPSEASSLLVRVTRNCPWNQCLICPAYKGTKFSRRTIEEVKKDIDSMTKSYSSYTDMITSAFLQDADTLIIPTEELVEIIGYLKTKFPKINRITSYARSKSMKKKSVGQYKALKEAGLSRIHTGMESGSARVLKMIKKGSRPEDIIAGGMRVMESGISLSEYIMPGVGGKELSREHAIETAKILNMIRPDFIRVRTFAMHPMSPMQKLVEDGTFVLMDDEEVVEEIRLLVENLDEMHSHFRCADFSLNLLMHVDGYLDEKKEAMLEELDKYLALSKEQKKAYSLLQRSYPSSGYPVDAVKDEKVMKQISLEIERLDKSNEDGFNKHIRQLMSYQLPQPQTNNWT